VNVFLVVIGFFLPPVAIIVMVTPIILPGLQAHGFDLVWYGIIMTIIMEMGLIHPPVGLNLFVINGIAPDIPFRDIIWGVLPFIVIMVLAIALLAFLPGIAMWLPNLS
jgi:TRAP-type C4-dicarboxylate transport system permease large subunit